MVNYYKLILKYILECFELGKTDLERYTLCTKSNSDYNNYLCEHGVVCKKGLIANGTVKLCVKCQAIAEAERADYERRHSGHVSEDNGYQIGSTISIYDSSRKKSILITYQGNDVWCDPDGHTWYAYLGENDCIHWISGLRSI